MRPRRLAAAAAALVLAGCAEPRVEEPPVEPATAEPAAVEGELDALLDRYQATYRAGDLRALAALHTPEYVEVGPRGEVLTRAGIDSAAADASPAGPEQEIEIRTDGWTVAESGDLAYGTGTSIVHGRGPDGAPVAVETRWLAGFRRMGGQWRIDRLMTSLPVGPPAPGGAARDAVD